MFFHTIELEIVGHIVCQSTWRLEVSHYLKEGRVLVLVELVLNYADELDTNTLMVDALALVQVYCHFALDVFTILQSQLGLGTYHEHWRFERVASLVFDLALLALVNLSNLYVNLAWGPAHTGEETLSGSQKEMRLTNMFVGRLL